MTERPELLVRSWNIAHGRDIPPRERDGYGHVRRKHLREMAELVARDGPDIVLLQEVPVWAGPLLHEHSRLGYTLAPCYGAHVPFVHVPLPLAVGAAVGRALPDIVRSQVEGQANAVLYSEALLLVSARRAQLNDRHRLRGEPRIAQLVRLVHRASGRELALANVHVDHADSERQVERAGYLLERFARGAPMLLGGDLNAGPRSRAVRSLVKRGWLEESGEASIDHLFVRGLEIEVGATRWLPEWRDVELDGRRVRLSDHDPVDAVVAFR